jgi:SAM-dependent methyltransferase
VSIPCIICDNRTNNERFIVKELQLGLGEEFEYQLCEGCGSMQILNPPTDLSKYYPNEDYYSFKMELKAPKSPGYLRKAKASYLLHGKNKLIGAILSIGYKIPEYYMWMKNTKASFNDKILDVGCGNGSLLTKLYKMGFTNLTGIDPFINDGYLFESIKIFKRSLDQMTGKFDLIMMHHALEHTSNPQKVLTKAYELLSDEKFLLVRVPVMGNYGWNKYRTYWAGLDAPRHMFIPSEKGMTILAEKAGFEIIRLDYDTVDYLIWCSEQYQNGISLYAANSRMTNKKENMFSNKQIKQFKRLLRNADRKGYGDTAAFYLKKK